MDAFLVETPLVCAEWFAALSDPTVSYIAGGQSTWDRGVDLCMSMISCRNPVRCFFGFGVTATAVAGNCMHYIFGHVLSGYIRGAGDRGQRG